MADKSDLPNPLHKRDLLYLQEKKSPVDHVAIGDAFFEAGRLTEAAQFYAEGEAKEKLHAVKDQAIKGGDAALLLAVAEALEVGVDEKDWVQLADAALKLEMYTSAAEAYQKAGRTEDAAKAREKLSSLLESVTPPEPVADPMAGSGETPGQAGGQTRIGG